MIVVIIFPRLFTIRDILRLSINFIICGEVSQGMLNVPFMLSRSLSFSALYRIIVIKYFCFDGAVKSNENISVFQ